MSLPPRFKTSIRRKLLLSFSLLMAGVALLVFTVFPAQLKQEAMSETIEQTHVIGDITAYIVTNALLVGDTAAAQGVLESARRGDVSYVEIRDAERRLFAARGRAELNREMVPTNSERVSSDGEAFVTARNIVLNGKMLGTLTTWTSLSGLHAKVQAAWRRAAFFALLIALVGFLVVYAISTLLTRPLRRLAEVASQVADGELTLRAIVGADREVAHVAYAFNQMVQSVAAAQQDLFEANQQLEARVAARTIELTDAVDEQHRVQCALTKSEAAVRRNWEMLQSLIDVAPQAILAADLNWRVTRWNKAAEKLFGWTADEIIGRPLPYLPDSKRSEFERVQALLMEGHEVGVSETVRRHRDGHLVSVFRAVSVLRDSDGRPLSYVAVLTDLTERKQLEELLRHSQKMEAVGCLAAGVAHDFNNMLTVITSCAEEMRQRPRGRDDAEDLEAIASSADRAAALTRQLLLFSRNQATMLFNIDVNHVVTEMQPMLRRLLKESIALTLELPDQQAVVAADATQLEQVIVNLVANASDAMEDEGTVTISTELASLGMDEAACHPNARAGQYLVLTVRDTGTGMDTATQARVFEPFFTTKPLGKGTGMGLATAYATVQRLGGHIRVQSVMGRGSAFQVYLPCAGGTTLATNDSISSNVVPEAARSGLTVLLVEDEPGVRLAIRSMLTASGHVVLDASNGEKALELAAAFDGSIDALLTDLMMPGIDGVGLSRRLTALHPEAQVVFMSAYADENTAHHGLLEPSAAFIQKPFSSEQLASAIRETLTRDVVEAPGTFA